MNEIVDKRIKDIFSGQEYRIPESYERKVDETIREIQDRSLEGSRSHRFWLADHKAAGAAIFILFLSVISVTSYAAINMFQKRMSSMPENVIEKYDQDVQKSDAEADTFSRELTASEEERLAALRKQYEEKGVFPEKEIKQVERKEEITEGVVCFAIEESKFYLPERTLSEEELLEIIDLQEKRDFSVQKENSTGESDGKGDYPVMDAEWKETSLDIVGKLYGNDKDERKVIFSGRSDDVYEYTVQGKNNSFCVYFSGKDMPDRVMYAKDGLPAHQAGVKINESEIRSLSRKMKKRVKLFTGKEIDSESIYCQVDDSGKLSQGTVSYYYQMKDGSGCVAVYSAAYKDLYDIYTVDGKQMEKQIKHKTESAERNGYRYRLIG